MFSLLRPYTKHKLQNRSSPCIFLGYSLSKYAFYCLERIFRSIYISRNVKFIQNQFPYSNLASSTTPPTSTPPINPTLHTINLSSIQTQPVQQVSHLTTNSTHNDLASISVPAPELPLAQADATIKCTHTIPYSSSGNTIITHSKNNIFKPKQIYVGTIHTLLENLELSTSN